MRFDILQAASTWGIEVYYNNSIGARRKIKKEIMRKKLIKTYLPTLCMLMFVTLYAGCQGCNRTQVSPSESRQYTGIPNIGNTCYMNSCLQIIARLYPDLFSRMSNDLRRHGQTIVDKITNENSRECVDKKEAQAFLNALLKSYNKKHKEKLAYRAQEDAAPVLSFLLSEGGATALELYNTTTVHPQEHNIPSLGVTLMVCLTGGNPLSMDHLVANTLLGEDVEDFACHQGVGGEARGNARVRTQLSIENLRTLTNRILPIWVQRGNQTSNNDPSSAAKVTTPITNPFKLTIPSEYFINIAPIARNTAYTGSLVGFILQTGQIDYGHYTAYVKTPAGRWIRYNDETVTELHEAPLSEAQAAYLYFYQAD